jgi:hypothetical protein
MYDSLDKDYWFVFEGHRVFYRRAGAGEAEIPLPEASRFDLSKAPMPLRELTPLGRSPMSGQDPTTIKAAYLDRCASATAAHGAARRQ